MPKGGITIFGSLNPPIEVGKLNPGAETAPSPGEDEPLDSLAGSPQLSVSELAVNVVVPESRSLAPETVTTLVCPSPTSTNDAAVRLVLILAPSRVMLTM